MGSNLQAIIKKIKESRTASAIPVSPEANQSPRRPASEHRAGNLRLLRAFFNSSQQEFERCLKLGSQSSYSVYERGFDNKVLPESQARRIEREFELPEGWFDRDNADSLFLSHEELALIMGLRASSPNAITALSNTVMAIKTPRL